MGRLHSRLAEPFTDTFKGGMVGYVTMISNVYAEMEEVIQDHPDCNESVPVDGSRMSYLLHRFAGTPYYDSIYDIYIQCQNQGSTFDEFVELIRNKYASADDSLLSFASSHDDHPASSPAPPTVIRVPPDGLQDDDHHYFDAQQPDDDMYFFNPTDEHQTTPNMKVFHLTLDYEFVRTHEVDTMLSKMDDQELLGYNEPFDTYAFGVRTAIMMQKAAELQPFLGYRPLEVIRKTLEVTMQLGATIDYNNLKAHFRSLLPWANKTRLDETVSTDTIFAKTRDASGVMCAQVFYGLRSHVINVYGMRKESEGPQRLDDFICEEGIPTVMRSDNSRMQRYGKTWSQRLRELLVHSEFSEPHNQQNPVELWAVRWLKDAAKVIRRRTGAPKSVWLQAAQYLADIHNMTADETLGWKTPRSVRRGTQTDISQLLQFQFWEPIAYLDTEEKYPSTKEKPGRWLGIAHNVGDFFCWKIYDEEKEIIIERSVVSSRRHKQNLAVEQELKELFGIEQQQGECSSDSDISFAEVEHKGVTDMA
jgi:hypothetical protein